MISGKRMPGGRLSQLRTRVRARWRRVCGRNTGLRPLRLAIYAGASQALYRHAVLVRFAGSSRRSTPGCTVLKMLLRGLIGSEERRDTSGASGFVEESERGYWFPRTLMPCLLYLAAKARVRQRKKSHPEPQILTTSYHDTALSRADLPNRPSP